MMCYKKIKLIKGSIIISIFFSIIIIGLIVERDFDIGFSSDSGFYESPFYLEMKSQNGEIHYTLDCTEPTLDSPIYNEPILIEDRSGDENVYSIIPDVYLGFNQELISLGIIDTEADPRKLPTEPVDKATIVKAAIFDKSGERISSKQGVFFVGYNNKNNYDDIQVVSISTDPDSLFDYENGIYVGGKTFDEYIVSLEDLSAFSIGYADANYKNKGKASRREANIVFFDKNKKITNEGVFDIAIQGGFTRCEPHKSLNIYETAYGKIDGYSLGFQKDLSSINLSSGGNDIFTRSKDAIINNCVKNLSFDTREYYPCVVFLEGEFWGVYYITEKYDELYFQNKYNVDSKDVEMIKGGTSHHKNAEIGDKSCIKEWEDVVNFITINDMSNQTNYEYVSEVIDLNSCIDYYATEIYVANTDWPGNNYAVWRSKSSSKRSEYDDGKWRFVLYDVNSALESDNVNLDSFKSACEADPMFRSLNQNADFNLQIKKKLVQLALNEFNPDSMNDIISNYHDVLYNPMQKDYCRFYGEKKISDFTDEFDDIIIFFELRSDYILLNYGDY